MQTYAVRKPAQDGYNNIGVVYVAPFVSKIGQKIESEHLVLNDEDSKLGDFYCLAEGFEPNFKSRNSQGHITSLAASLAFMDNAYPSFEGSEDYVDVITL
jgi:hypothetical protein